MNILHIAPLTMKKSSGLTYSIPNFVRFQNSIRGIKSDLLVSVKADEIMDGFYYLNNFSNRIDIVKFLDNYDIVIFHSTYIYNHIKLSKILRNKKIPYIIVPRGGFSKKSKKIKKFKKILGDMLLFDRFFKSPNAIHYLTYNEKMESCYRTDNDFVIPNGINMPGKIKDIDNTVSKKIKFVYIGRMDSYIKGLDVLVDAINIIKQELRDFHVEFFLYGPDSSNSKDKLRRQTQAYEIDDIVKIEEAIFNDDKIKILNDANVFIQTSRFEGLPMGVLEALSIGLPCILTPGTNISDQIVEFEAGFAVDLTPDSISSGILNIIKEIKSGKNYSSNAFRLAKQYSWMNIAKLAVDKYEVIVKKGTN